VAVERRVGQRNQLIHVVDDDESLCVWLSMSLVDAGFEVATARHATDIVERAIVSQPCVIILDVEIPGIDGQAALRALKTDPRTNQIPVVMCSGDMSSGWQTVATANGCTSCLTKPASIDLLLDAVRHALRRGAGTALT
jgi:CheY-like chemotaxis protein